MYHAYTIKDIVNNLINIWGIEDNKKNTTKIRQQLTRQLKKNNKWSNAKTKIIGRNKTKYWTAPEVDAIKRSMEPYMAKISNIDYNEILKKRKLIIDEYFADPNEIDYAKDDELQAMPTNQELVFVMIKKLFEEKYKINITQWKNDKFIINEGANIINPDIETIKAYERLKNPAKSYITKK